MSDLRGLKAVQDSHIQGEIMLDYFLKSLSIISEEYFSKHPLTSFEEELFAYSTGTLVIHYGIPAVL